MTRTSYCGPNLWRKEWSSTWTKKTLKQCWSSWTSSTAVPVRSSFRRPRHADEARGSRRSLGMPRGDRTVLRQVDWRLGRKDYEDLLEGAYSVALHFPHLSQSVPVQGRDLYGETASQRPHPDTRPTNPGDCGWWEVTFVPKKRTHTNVDPQRRSISSGPTLSASFFRLLRASWTTSGRTVCPARSNAAIILRSLPV